MNLKFQSNINYKRTRSKYQQLEKNILYLDEALLKHECQQLTQRERELLNSLIYLSNHYTEVYVSQTTLARYLDISRKQINRLLLKLEAKGLVFSFYRHMSTCVYSIPALFYQEKIRKGLSHMFNALRIFPLIWLTTMNGMIQTGKVTQLVYVDYNVLFTKRMLLDNQHKHTPSTYSKLTDSKKRARPLSTFFHEYHKKGEEMDNFEGTNPITQDILDITEIKLTKWGQIKLSGFPSEAIKHARKQYKFCRSWNKFGWFFNTCLAYCKDNDLKVDWDRLDLLKEVYKMPADAPMLIERTSYAEREKNFNKGNAESKSYVAKPYKLQQRDIDYEVEYHKYEVLRKDPKHSEHLKRFNESMGLSPDHNPFSGALTSPVKTSPPPTLRDTINTMIPRHEVAPTPMSHNSFQDIDEDADTEFEF